MAYLNDNSIEWSTMQHRNRLFQSLRTTWRRYRYMPLIFISSWKENGLAHAYRHTLAVIKFLKR